MTREELNALIELLNRIPLTQSERLWLQALISRELAKLQKEE